MRVLVTGATGLIGSTVCDALMARGDEVVGLTRDPEKAKRDSPAMRWYEWRPSTERPPPEAFDEVDAVVNMVGEEIDQRLTDKAKLRIRESRITATRNLLQAIEALESRPATFVGQSAIGYYGDRGEAILDEDAAPGEGFGGEITVDWEAAELEAEKLGMRTVVFRTGLILTRHGGLLKQLLTPFKLGLGGPLAGGEQYMSWIAFEDEVALVLWALDNEEVRGILNATAPNPVTNKVFSKALADAINRPAVVPAPKLAVAALKGRELAEMATGSARVVPRRATDLGFEFRHPEIGDGIRAALK